MNKQYGFNLIELMIALVIGLVLMMSITTMFVDTKLTANRSATVSSLQQQAQLALQILVDDVRGIGSWGEFTGGSLKDISVPEDENMVIGGCAIGSASGAKTTNFPVDANWISNDKPNGNCFAAGYSYSASSDALSIARIQGRYISDVASAAAAALDETRYYIAASPQAAKLFIGAKVADIANMKNAAVYPYLRRAYFVETHASEAPRLKRFSLQNEKLVNDLTVANIERIHIEFGVDSDANGIADIYYASNNANFSVDMWNNNQIVTARIYVLARATNMDASFNNTSNYQLDSDGDDNNGYKPNDNYRRFLLSTTVVIKNNVMAANL